MITNERTATRNTNSGLRTALTIAALLIVVAILIISSRRGDDRISTLQLPATRIIEGRLTPFGYAPFVVHRGGGNAANLRALAVAGDLGVEVEKARTAENLHRYGIAVIAAGKTSLGAELLRQASSLKPDDPALMSDLAAAQLAAGSPLDALENAGRALELDHSFAPAAFNRALALETVSNRRAAVRAWQQYCALDDSTSWRAEAQQRLSQLTAPHPNWDDDKLLLVPATPPDVLQRVVRSYPQRVRTWVVDELLPRWVDLRRADDLALLNAIANARAAGGDTFLSDVAAGARACNADFAAGICMYREARMANRQHRDLSLAGAKLDAAARMLERARSPVALLASIYAASNESYRGMAAEADARLHAIDGELQRYPSIAAEALWVRALMHTRRGEHSEGLRALHAALDLATRAGETENVVALTALIATELDELAEPAEADRYRVEALRRMDAIGASPQRMYVAIADSALMELQRHRPHAALDFIDTQQMLAAEAGDPMLISEAATARALALHDAGGRYDAAIAAVDEARRHAGRVPAETLRNRTLAESEYVTALVCRDREPDRALQSLTSAMQRWDQNGWRFHVAAARLALGDIRLQRGDRSGAESEYRAGISAMEQTRGALDEAKLRIAYFERAEALFERLIALLVDERRPEDALSIAERKRARALLDAAEDGRAATPLDVASLRAALPPNSALLEYELLPDTVIVWYLDAQGVSAVRTAHRDELLKNIEACRDAISRNDAVASRAVGRKLYEELIAPFATKLAGRETIIIVPDRELCALPFSAVVDASGKYLIESHTIAFAPSASFRLRDTSHESASKSIAVLAVAQPAPRDCAVLRHAWTETTKLAGIYDHAAIYVGAEMQPAEFLRRASESQVVSFAGHATANALLFESRGDQPPAQLASTEVAASRFSSHPLVVLAACSTARGNVRAVEGADSLATAFLAAGARSVIATLWDVDDGSSERLFIALHSSIERGMTASVALREAQLAMLRSDSPADRNPASWAGVVVTGSN